MKIEPKQVIENRYEIIEKLGEGGMGEVWKALDTNLGDEVVIKMPLNHLDADILRRFEREARSMRKHSLECPQILNIEDIGNLDGTPWYVMRYLGGGTVCERALSKNNDGSVNWTDRTFDWLTKIASALDYLHKEDCFHRDVKPENILFSSEGTPYLVDFGIVKTVNETTSMMTEQGKTVGTMAYMAPEILDGGQFSGQSDQYSLAVTLYEFLTGERPFSGTTFFSLFRSIQQGHRKLSELHPAIPLAASQVVDRAFSGEPSKRFSSCSAFVEAFLAGLQTDQAVEPPSDDLREDETRELILEQPEKVLQDNVNSRPEDERISPVKPDDDPNGAGKRKSVGVPIIIAGVLTVVSGLGVAYGTGMFDGATRSDVPTTPSSSSAVADATPATNPVTPQTTQGLFDEAEALYASSPRTANDVEQAIENLKQAAFDDHLPSQKRLGQIYSEGDGVEQDYEKAFDWLRRAAGQNDAESQFYVALSYAKGDIGVDKDTKEAIRWYQKSADQNFSPALVAIGMHYLRGDGVTKDLKQAKTYFTKADSNDFPPAQSALELVDAEIEANKPKPLSKLEQLELAAEEGKVQSQFELAEAYEDGKLGLRKNSKTALRFYLKAAENDHVPSQRLLAKRYEDGIKPFSTSYTDATKWYQRAADQGDSDSKRRLSELKAGGGKTGFLASRGSKTAQYDLGQMFTDGSGVKQDFDEAAKWFRKSAAQGSDSAQFQLGFLYQQGLLGERDYPKAVEWYLKSANQGNKNALFNLGRIYQKGATGVEQSDKEAVRWYRLAANQGDRDARKQLKILLPEKVRNSIGIRFVHLEDGNFSMGSMQTEKERNSDEPLHRVEIKKDLYFSEHEITIGQFRRFVQETGHRTKAEKTGIGSSSLDPLTGEMYEQRGYSWQNPGYPVSDNHPVSQISWDDANSFATWLGKKDGKHYRLPTEAEWEYAARAGTNTTYSSGNSYESLKGFANVLDQSRRDLISPERRHELSSFHDGNVNTSPVGSYRPNDFGLYDMHGNVWEWCYDTYDSEAYKNSKKQNPFSKKSNKLRVMRGGCFM